MGGGLSSGVYRRVTHGAVGAEPILRVLHPARAVPEKAGLKHQHRGPSLLLLRRYEQYQLTAVLGGLHGELHAHPLYGGLGIAAVIGVQAGQHLLGLALVHMSPYGAAAYKGLFQVVPGGILLHGHVQGKAVLHAHM